MSRGPSVRLLLVLVVVGSLLNVSCAAYGAEKQVLVRLAHNGVPGIHLDIVCHKFGEILEEKTGGKMKVQVYAQTLGGGKDLVEQVSLGTIEMYADGYTGEPVYDLLSIPYLFRDTEHFKKVVLGDIGKRWSDVWVKNKGIRCVGVFFRLPRQLTTSNRPVYTPSDVKGLKIRVPEWEEMVVTWETLGANPTPVAWPEVFQALQTGVVEGQDNPIDLVYDSRLYEVQKYLMLIDYIQHAYFVGVNDRWYRSLPADLRTAFDASLREAEAFNEKRLSEMGASYLEWLEKKGMTVIRPDINAFKNALKDVPVRLQSKIDRLWGKGVYEAIQNTK